MKIHLAIKSSQIHVAIRPSLLPPRGARLRVRRAFEQKHRTWEQPFIAASNLVKFDRVTGEPVYETRVYNNTGTPMALVLAKKLEDWEPLDEGDPITLLSDLAGDEQLVARQERVTERKRVLDMREGAEWKCQDIADIYAEKGRSPNTFLPPPPGHPFGPASISFP
jgi:hypothetical protein